MKLVAAPKEGVAQPLVEGALTVRLKVRVTLAPQLSVTTTLTV